MALQDKDAFGPATTPAPDMPAALAALVLALEEQGALSRDRYRDILVGLWTAMPEDEAFDREAQTCERLLEFLDVTPLTTNSAAPGA
jgi:hypothetical protein